MIDYTLFADLRKKLGRSGVPVSRQAVEQRRAKLQKLVPMPTDVATYIVAQRAGVRIHSYLDEGKLNPDPPTNPSKSPVELTKRAS